MKNLLSGLILLLCASIIVTSCKKAESEDPANDGELSYYFNPINLSASVSATASESGKIVPALSKGSITWISGSFNIQKLTLTARKNQSDFKVEYKDLYNMSVQEMTNAGSIALPAGSYTNAELTINLVQSATNVPVSLKGIFTDAQGNSVPVEMQFNYTYEMKGKLEDVTIKGDKYKATVQVALNNLVSGLTASDFTQATRSGADNAVVISTTSNTTLFVKLIQNLPFAAAVDIQHQ